MKKWLCILSFLTVVLNGMGQDIHFSQSDLSPVNLNPSLTGFFDADGRVHLNQRTQWRSVTVPYRTFSASVDGPFRKIKLPGYAGLGLVFNTDKAGDGEMGTSQIGVALAWHWAPVSDSSIFLSAGMVAAYNQLSVNYSGFYFGRQFNGFLYDPSLPNGENFPDSKITYFDISPGASVFYKIHTIPIIFGVSVHHLTRPAQSFFGSTGTVLDVKWTWHAMSEIKTSSRVLFMPQLFLYRQGTFTELDAGGLMKLSLNSLIFRSLYLGGWYRVKDAAILCFAFDYQNFRFGFSYDLNVSSLSVASHGMGGLELSVRYLFTKSHKGTVNGKLICPPYL